MTDLVQQVLASRKAHGLRRSDVADFRRFSETLPRVAAVMGFADHASQLSVVIDAGNELTRGERDERAYAMLAFVDGYAFAKHLHNAPVEKGKALTSKSALTRFLRASARSGPALLAGPHADAARALLESLGPADEAAREVMANAFACGVLLFQHEHSLALQGFEALSAAAPKKQKGASKTAVAHVASLPKALLAGVMAAPHDDAPRLVLADWLTEQGDPRGEFIQVQCALGRALFGAEARWVRAGRKALPFETREQLEARELELIKAHEKQWVAPIRKVVRQWGFRRGFVNRVIADLATFAAATDGELAETPLESAKLTGFKASQLPGLCKAAPHATLETLRLGMNRLDDAAAELFRAPLLSRVNGLDLEGNPLGPACLEALATPRAVRRLSLHAGVFDDAALCRLAKAPWWSSLTGLALHRCQALTPGALEAVDVATGLDWLSLDVNGLTDADVVRVAKAHPKLRQLSFTHARVSEQAVEAVLEALPQLVFFDVPYSLPEAAQARLRARFAGATYASLMGGD